MNNKLLRRISKKLNVKCDNPTTYNLLNLVGGKYDQDIPTCKWEVMPTIF